MVLHTDITTAIPNDWNAPKYDGSQDVRQWLKTIEELCNTHGIPPAQMTEIGVKCTAGEANLVLKAMFEAKVAEVGVWLWADFKECVIRIQDRYRQNMKDAPQNAEGGDFRSQHPYVAATLAVTMVGVGTFVALPGIVAGILGAVGFGAGGVAAGSIAAGLQSAFYGGATGGLFSACQSLGATIVAPSLLTTIGGLRTAVAGIRQLGFAGGAREDPPAAES